MTTAVANPKAFAVWFKDLDRWDPASFERITWKWPKEAMRPISGFLRPRREKVDRDKYQFSDLQPITIHFDGSIDRRKMDGSRAYTMELFFARPGDVVVAKIDLKNGAVAIVPDWKNAAVTGHFAVFEPDREAVLPEYFLRVIQTNFFKAHLWRNKVGAEGRKEVKLDFFEALEIPLPPLAVQRAIVRRWQEAQATIGEAQARADALEADVFLSVYKALGTPTPKADEPLPKVLALWWKDLERWSFNYLARAGLGLLGFTKSKYPIRPLADVLLGTMNGYCIRPVATPTPHKMLKLNTLAPAGLDLSQTKYITVSGKTAKRFCLCRGDLLICRSVGSYDHVAKCALVEEDHGDILFPDIIIRARFKDTVLPEFVREVIQTPLGRSYFQSNARTGVGMWKIGKEDIWGFPIPLPPLTVQRSIVDMVAKKRAEVARERQAAAKLSAEVTQEMEEMILGTRPVKWASA